MRNLLIFITKYNAFFLFLIFEIGALVIYGKYNAFQKASIINSTNNVTGNFYARYNELERYLSLQEVNDKLARDNAKMRNLLKSSYYTDSAAKHRVNDTVYKQQYEYVTARVINNSVNRRNNYLTINVGTNEGVARGMGVMCDQGIVGIVREVSPHFSVIQSLLHKDTRFSAMLVSTKARGTLKWDDGFDPQIAQLSEVTNNVQPHLGEQVVTSELSLFPAGVAIGRVSNLHTKSGGFFLNMEVRLAVNFAALQYVYVVKNKFGQEQAGLEALEKKDE